MHHSLLALSLLGSAVQAAPTESHPPLLHNKRELCGPTSNCQRVERNGHMVYEFKEGEEPGTDNYAKRMAKVKRAEEEIISYITIGDTKIDVGCDMHVTPIFDQLWSLCPEVGGTCDSGTEGTREIEWTDGSPPEQRDIKIKADGTYGDKDTRDKLIWAIKETVRPETIEQEELKWTGSGGRIGYATPQGTCKMNRFPNYIGVARFGVVEGGELDLKSDMKVWLELGEQGDGICANFMKASSSIVGAVNGWAGGFFGLLEMSCEL